MLENKENINTYQITLSSEPKTNEKYFITSEKDFLTEHCRLYKLHDKYFQVALSRELNTIDR